MKGGTVSSKLMNLRKEPFKRLVILGESTVQGGPWLRREADRFADVLVRLINACQDEPIEYFNKGIGANAISPRSPGYEASAKPSALERYRDDVIAREPDLFILCYGLNDMRAGMPLEDFREDMAAIIRDTFQLTPRGIIEYLDLLRPIYFETARHGHFGRELEQFTWERTDQADALRKAAGL